MNIHQLGNRTGISLAILRKLDKLKVLKIEAESDAAAEIRFHLMRNQRMTVAQCLTLIADPSLVDELGKYATRASAMLLELGDVQGAPNEVAAEISQAAKGDDDAALVIAQWLMQVLPAGTVPHAWVAVRLLLPLNEFMRVQYLSLVGLALMNVRRLPEFAGYWRSVKIGGKNEIRYFAVDALDL